MSNKWTDDEIVMLKSMYGKFTKRQIADAIPKHTAGSIVMKAIKLGFVKKRTSPYAPWTSSELKLLKDLYPDAMKRQISLAIPSHPWCSIQEKAKALGISRFWRTHRARKRSSIPVIGALRELRIRRRISATELAAKIGVDRDYLCKMELSVYNPRFQNLINWCEALGVELAIQPIDTK